MNQSPRRHYQISCPATMDVSRTRPAIVAGSQSGAEEVHLTGDFRRIRCPESECFLEGEIPVVQVAEDSKLPRSPVCAATRGHLMTEAYSRIGLTIVLKIVTKDFGDRMSLDALHRKPSEELALLHMRAMCSPGPRSEAIVTPRSLKHDTLSVQCRLDRSKKE
ncbi:hypothetical protein J6590_083841 [Homalodisca vitripennis]|nr:hypothetical protein J6590_083841 [Homalodisca vitripennis]